MPRGFTNKLHPAPHMEFCQQRRNVKFNCSFREIEVGSNFLVGETFRDAGKNFFFPACQSDLAVNGLPGLKQLVSLFNEVFQHAVLCLDQNSIVAGRSASNQAMHGKKSGRLIYRKTPIGSRLHMKVGNARVFFVKEEGIAVGNRTRSEQLMRMVTSADHLHVHPLECSLVMEPKP